MEIDFNSVERWNISEGSVFKVLNGSLVIWKKKVYKNLVHTSIDTDGSVYNGTGFINGYRLSSSGSLTAQANTTTTGFIPYSAGNVIRMAGALWKPIKSGSYSYLCFYDSSFTFLGCLGIHTDGNYVYEGIVAKTSTVTIENDITTFNPVFSSNADNIAYIRVNGYGIGEHLIVTVNDRFEEYTVNYTNQLPISIDADGNIYNGTGYKDDYRLRSGGAEAASATVTITGYIPLKIGDTLRIYPAFTGENTGNTVNFFNSSFTNLGQITDSGASYGICADKVSLYKSTVIDGVSTLTLNSNHDSNIAYVRVGNNMYICGTGENMIITVNEEIKL